MVLAACAFFHKERWDKETVAEIVGGGANGWEGVEVSGSGDFKEGSKVWGHEDRVLVVLGDAEQDGRVEGDRDRH